MIYEYFYVYLSFDMITCHSTLAYGAEIESHSMECQLHTDFDYSQGTNQWNHVVWYSIKHFFSCVCVVKQILLSAATE